MYDLRHLCRLIFRTSLFKYDIVHESHKNKIIKGVTLKSLLFAVLLVLTTSTAFARDTQSDQTPAILSLDSVDAARAILACPEEAAAFASRTQLMTITVVQNSPSEKVFAFEGKRLLPGGYRSLLISVKRGATGNVGGVTYVPVLVE